MVSLHKEWINLGREEVRRIYFLIYMFGFFFPLEGSKWKAKILSAELNDSLSPSEGTSFGEAATPSTLINFFHLSRSTRESTNKSPDWSPPSEEGTQSLFLLPFPVSPAQGTAMSRGKEMWILSFSPSILNGQQIDFCRLSLLCHILILLISLFLLFIFLSNFWIYNLPPTPIFCLILHLCWFFLLFNALHSHLLNQTSTGIKT